MARKPIFISYASGIGGVHPEGCRKGPETIEKSDFLPLKVKFLHLGGHPNLAGPAAVHTIRGYSQDLAKITEDAIDQRQQFITIGGDHSCAIGSWSGAAKALDEIGLIWIDAHMDSHTPETSHTGNTHGMPLATLLGHGDQELTTVATDHTKLKPENVCLIGIRSYETEEAHLLQELGVKIFYMEEVKKRGIAVVLAEAVDYVNDQTAGFGLSIDIDAIDPNDAPGVGVPEKDGINADEFLNALKSYRHDQHLVGIDIAEYNPDFDIEKKTEKIVCDIISNLFVKGDRDATSD